MEKDLLLLRPQQNGTNYHLKLKERHLLNPSNQS